MNYDEFKREYKRLWLLAQKPENFLKIGNVFKNFGEHYKEYCVKFENELAQADNYLEVIEKIQHYPIVKDGVYRHPEFGNGYARDFLMNGAVDFDCEANGRRELVNQNELFLIYDPNAVPDRILQKEIQKFEDGKKEFPIGQIVYVGCDNLQAVVLDYDDERRFVEIMFIGDNDRRGQKKFYEFPELVK